jgi:hypothetical protein
MSSFNKTKVRSHRQQAIVKRNIAYCLLPIACLLLASCNFRPVYGTASALPASSPLREGVRISADVSGVVTQVTETASSSTDNTSNSAMARQFANNLGDMLPSKDAPAYELQVSIVQSNVGIGVARDGTASRYNYVLNSSYNLVRIADGKIVDSGSLSNVTSYNNPNNQYFSTYISQQDARRRGIKELAESYRMRLISYIEKQQPTSLPLSAPPPDEDCPKVC